MNVFGRPRETSIIPSPVSSAIGLNISEGWDELDLDEPKPDWNPECYGDARTLSHQHKQLLGVLKQMA